MTSTLLTVEQLNAGYGASQVLDNVTFSMGTETACIVGRNGAGKTTLCNSLLGLVTPTSGKITFAGSPIAGLPPERIARRGIAYVPQGRRLFSSLTVDEHLAMLAKRARGKPWTRERVLDLFPRLAQCRKQRGAELSGGEQQMLAVARALLLNGQLIIMDEPTEGLAPAIVDTLIDVIHRLASEGVAILVVEQNLRAATEMATRQLIMVSGGIETETTAEFLATDRDFQRLHLGVDA